MSNILVSGLINIETTLKVDGFPVQYEPVRYPFWGVHSAVSGVGYNVAKALTTLGDTVSLLSLIGGDLSGQTVARALAQADISADCVLAQLAQTAQSVILYEPSGRRQIHVDLKDIQEQVYPLDRFDAALAGCDLAVLCNINFSRPLLARARQAGVPIATDVHTIADLDDPYNREFMAAADVLFMSDAKLPCPPEEWARRLQGRFGTAVIVIGLGAEGALLAVKGDGALERVTAAATRPVVNTIGAGDALFSAFIHIYHQTGNPYNALRQAVVFASYKIGETGAANGFLTAAELAAWVDRLN
ncbi:MAG: carbohydrate kinase family protein [Chloroflexi bacterium]|nr:carbohydrate kinase family protein [Chloroflexota bacterium]